jgi:phosphatidylglycerol:prolipoprotein diacylglycerol transferase
MFFAFYVHHLSPFLIQFNEQVGIRWYGLAYIAGFIGAFYLMKWLARKGYGPLRENQVADCSAFSSEDGSGTCSFIGHPC